MLKLTLLIIMISHLVVFSQNTGYKNLTWGSSPDLLVKTTPQVRDSIVSEWSSDYDSLISIYIEDNIASETIGKRTYTYYNKRLWSVTVQYNKGTQQQRNDVVNGVFANYTKNFGKPTTNVQAATLYVEGDLMRLTAKWKLPKSHIIAESDFYTENVYIGTDITYISKQITSEYQKAHTAKVEY